MNLEIINTLLGIMANGVRFYAIKRIIDIFLSKDKCLFRHMWVLYAAACGWTSLIYELFMSPAWNILANLTGLLLVVSPYKIKVSRKLLLVSMIYIVNALVDCIVVLPFVKYVVGKSFNQMYECITSLVILLIAIILEKTIKAESDIDLPAFYRVILGSVPVVSIICMYSMILSAGEMKITMIIVSSGILFINIMIIYIYHSLVQFYSEKIQKKIFEQMVDVYAYQLELVRESQEQVKALRHDMKHHIIELSSMIKDNAKPEVMKYLQDMGKFMLNPKEHVETGNKEIDGVLNYLLQNVDEVLEYVDIKINMPEKMYWTNFNVSVILGNLVDNAIREAGKSEEKYLVINVQSKKGILVIFIENSYSGKITEENGRLRTSQKNLAVHGLGVENVKKIVEANGGEMKITYTENRFKVEVLLYLSNIK